MAWKHLWILPFLHGPKKILTRPRNALKLRDNVKHVKLRMRRTVFNITYLICWQQQHHSHRLPNLFFICYVSKSEQECFIMFKITRRSPVVLDGIKHMLQAFWTASKAFAENCVNRVHHNYAFVNVRNCLTSKALGSKLVCKSTWGPVPEFFEILRMPRKREI